MGEHAVTADMLATYHTDVAVRITVMELHGNIL